jgi:hypothetical protein
MEFLCVHNYAMYHTTNKDVGYFVCLNVTVLATAQQDEKNTFSTVTTDILAMQ